MPVAPEAVALGKICPESGRLLDPEDKPSLPNKVLCLKKGVNVKVHKGEHKGKYGFISSADAARITFTHENSQKDSKGQVVSEEVVISVNVDHVLRATKEECQFHSFAPPYFRRSGQTMADVFAVFDFDDLVLMDRTYWEYTRVVVAIGAFFGMTGIQWSFFIDGSTQLEERKGLCHHNTMCNLATETNLGSMGLNPDMVWSNGAYWIAAFFIMVCTRASQRRKQKMNLCTAFLEDMRGCLKRLSPLRALTAPLRDGQSSQAWDDSEAAHTDKIMAGHWDMTSGFEREVTEEFRLVREQVFTYKGLAHTHCSGMYYFVAMCIFVEGGLSGLYHTCPSKNFQQFDYIGITMCELSIFLLLWSKTHIRMPTAGTFALYVAQLGILAAFESSVNMQESKQNCWLIFGVWIILVCPVVGMTLQYGADTFVSYKQIIRATRYVFRYGFRLNHRSQKYAVSIGVVSMLYALTSIKGTSWAITVAIFATYLSMLCASLIALKYSHEKAKHKHVVKGGRVKLTTEYTLTEVRDGVPIEIKLDPDSEGDVEYIDNDGDALISFDSLKSDERRHWIFCEHFDALESVRSAHKIAQPWCRCLCKHGRVIKMHEAWAGWSVVPVLVFVWWTFIGLEKALKGYYQPALHNMAHAIMMWHGMGAFLYSVYFYCGLFYFQKAASGKDSTLIKQMCSCRSALLFLLVLICLGCVGFGGEFFVNGSYKANAAIKLYNISCADETGAADNSVCSMTAMALLNETTTMDYSCGTRDGNLICLIGSLDYNQVCAMGKLDGHSLWHGLSAIGLCLLPICIMILDSFLTDEKTTLIPVI